MNGCISVAPRAQLRPILREREREGERGREREGEGERAIVCECS